MSTIKRFATLYTLVFSLALIAFSAYALLDAFVISRVYRSAVPVGEAVAAATASPLAATASAPESSPSVYWDENMSITLRSYRENDTNIYVADVQLSSPSLLKAAFSQNSYGKNVTASTSDTASRTGAILAVNGDNYGSREKGYVIRNGVLFRDAAAKGQEDLVVWTDGSFSIIDEAEVSAQALLDSGAVHVFSFGPGLIEDGSITVSANDEVDRAKASNPRTAIGILDDGHYVFVVSDGRTDDNKGLSLYELAQFMQSLGVETAYNLDGGGSSTMVFQGEVINDPSSGRRSGERAVTDIVYIGY